MLVPVLIKILRKIERGSLVNDYPDFNRLPPEVREGMDWAHFIDAHGIQIHYDKVGGFGQKDEYNDNPNMQYCGTLVPEAFARAAAQMFPERVELMSESEWAEFYDTRCHDHEPEHQYDVNVLQALVAKQQLGIPFTDSDKKALDPEHPTAGIRKNLTKCWSSVKANRVIEVHPDFQK